jgi:hypothetical protein
VWGQVRPGSGPQAYVLQIRDGGAWTAIGGTRKTTTRGYFRLVVDAAKGSQLRIWYPARRLASATLVVR